MTVALISYRPASPNLFLDQAHSQTNLNTSTNLNIYLPMAIAGRLISWGICPQGTARSLVDYALVSKGPNFLLISLHNSF
jgi:hypothetical protein